MPHERLAARRGEGRLLHAAAEPADEVAREVLDRGEAPPAAVVRRPRPGPDRPQVGERLVERGVVDARQVPGPHGRPEGVAVEAGEVEATGDDAVLDVVHRVGDVVGEVHHLRLEAAPAPLDAVAQPVEDRAVVVVDAELHHHARGAVGVHAVRAVGRRARPGVLGAGVEGGPGEVEPDRPAVGVEGLRLQPGQQAQRLGVALEPAAPGAELGQRPLAVVAEGRVAEVVRERRGLGDVGVRAERPGEVAGDLGDLEAVREPVADEVVGLRTDDLRLRGEPPRRGRVDDARPVALERQPHGRVDALGRLGDDALARRVVVQVLDAHRPVSLASTEDADARPGRSGGSVDGDVHVVVVVGRRRPTVGHASASPRRCAPPTTSAGRR